MTQFLKGSDRLFNNHSVCMTCGAMVDNEFVRKHIEFHQEDTE